MFIAKDLPSQTSLTQIRGLEVQTRTFDDLGKSKPATNLPSYLASGSDSDAEVCQVLFQNIICCVLVRPRESMLAWSNSKVNILHYDVSIWNANNRSVFCRMPLSPTVTSNLKAKVIPQSRCLSGG